MFADTRGNWNIEINNAEVKIADIISTIVRSEGRIRSCRQLEPNLVEIYDKIVK